MRVGLYTECLTKPNTGVEQATKALIGGLKHHDITCFHSDDKNHPKLNTKHKTFRKPLSFPVANFISAMFRSSFFNNVDVLHLQYPQIVFGKKPNVPVVMTVHDITPAFLPKFHNWKRTIFFNTLLPHYLRKVDAIIASSNSTKEDLVKYYKIPANKINVVHLSAPSKIIKPKKKENFILYVGTLEPRKNVEGIIEAFALLKSKGYKQKLIIAGRKGWNYKKVFQLIKRYKLQNDVIYKGYVSEKEKSELYAKAQLFVWPSFYEGFGLPLLEAMAHGTPVVAGNTSSIPEVVGDAGILVNPNSPVTIATGMQTVLDSSQRQKELVMRGFKRVKQFTVENMVKKIEKVYEKVQ